MNVERCGQAGRRLVVFVAVPATLLCASVAGAQNSPSLLDKGVAGAMYGRCQTDVLSNDLLRSAAALGAFAPATVSRITAGGDEMTVIATMCAHQIHQHRCTQKIVAVAGDVLMQANPTGRAVAPSTVNPGTIVGGTAGLVTGVILGNREGAGTAIGAGVIGGTLGAAGGAAYWNKQQMNACIDRQQQLDRMSANLTGSVPSLSLGALQALMVSNVQRRTISQADADTLITEANKLSQRTGDVFQAMR